jgi:hypothetical protein
METKDYVIAAVKAEPGITATDLTVRVWGTSGRGSTKLTKGLFPAMAAVGMIKAVKQGRTTRYYPS